MTPIEFTIVFLLGFILGTIFTGLIMREETKIMIKRMGDKIETARVEGAEDMWMEAE